DSDQIAARIEALTAEVLARLAPGIAPAAHGVEVVDGFLGNGYGLPTAAMVDAVTLLARSEGVLLDPVYSGKGMAGLLAMLERGAFVDDDDLIFLHTGGAQALSVYTSAFTD
ncbi:MAG: pyridoxal-phosphate dependent enzyme, partial [Gammaproteobacteria bacterium]